jgi:hypothetical protein
MTPNEDRHQSDRHLGGAMSAFQEHSFPGPSDLVVSLQWRTWVSVHEDGDVVIHQDSRDDGDVFVFISPQNVPALSKALLKAAGLDSDATARELTAKRATANERQRRHRERLRDSHGQDNVTVTANPTSEVDGYHQEEDSAAAG